MLNWGVMTVDDIKTTVQTNQEPASLEAGTYEIIKNRLLKQGKDLIERLDKLNKDRRDVFGSIDTTIIGSERIITDNNCIPRDMAPVGNSFIFGYNVRVGLKSKVELEDVFSIYEFKNRAFQKLSLSLIDNARFKTDFDELYKYYKNTFFAKFTLINPYLYMIFQTGKNPTDIKAYKWLIEDGKLIYVDNRSDHEVRFSSNNGFDWIRARREDQVAGLYPHISILDRVFVETVGGDLTIKVENNTDTGKGIYSEPVEDKDQTLDDAEIYYTALANLILLKIRPYKEKDYRYFVFNSKLQNVVRLDAIKDACVLLPDDHGLIFPMGYYLKDGEYKLFDVPVETSIFEQRLDSVNGEDYQYFFYNIESGTYLIYSYNIIEQTIETPIVCCGYSHFSSGEMVVFKHEDEPRKNHMLQLWQTPYVGKDFSIKSKSESLLYSIGNKDIVNCISDCRILYNMIQKGEIYEDVYIDIVKESDNIIDSYFWLDREEAYRLKDVLIKIKDASSSAVAEFEKVTMIKRTAQKQSSDVNEKVQQLLKEIEFSHFDNVDAYVKVLAKVRILRGEIVSLSDLRYVDVQFVQSLEAQVKEKSEQFSKKCVEFLLKPEGLEPYSIRVGEHSQKILSVSKSSEGKELLKDISQTSSDLELLIDIVSNLKIDDPTQSTRIIESISVIYSQLNQAKAKLKNHMDELAKSEGIDQFHSQMKLLSQAVVNYLDISDSYEKCEEYLNKVIVQIEELEGKFADFEEFIVKLADKREEIYNAFESRKQTLLEKQNRRIAALASSAERIVNGIANRLSGFESISEINGYVASDIMIEKVRDIVEQLNALGDSVEADEIEARLKTVKEDAIRQLKDKQELFVGGENTIKLGRHYFSVNTQQLELSIVQKDEELYFHISGTDFWEKVCSDEVDSFQHVWAQEIPSENSDVYRGEYLAYKIYEAALKEETESIEKLSSYLDEELLAFVQKFMEPRYQEVYSKGVHDVDGQKILKALLQLNQNIDLLIYSPSARAMAQMFWGNFADGKFKAMLTRRLTELSKVSRYFESRPDIKEHILSVVSKMESVYCSMPFFDKMLIPEAAEYLCMEMMRGDSFVISLEAEEIYKEFMTHLKEKSAQNEFLESLRDASKDIEGAFYIVREWLYAFLKDTDMDGGYETVDEVIVMIILGSYSEKQVIRTRTKITVSALNGNHVLISKGEYVLSYTAFMKKLENYDRTTVRDFLKFQAIKKELVMECREELRLDNFKPSILSSFVRNRLIDKVYLPLVGDNLAKQIGAAGEDKRTDLMGLLLLISPPGYGKTTLMEYVANRLGLTMIKINGPALGNEVTSLDPDKARNAGAKEELRKLNLGFRMGNNVMVYIDDIQHCNPEFLQKFISLCDGQRKIEGVYKGVGQTYYLRGKKVCVVMAGNPYTESGDKFKIPDMLANRADVYNLGDMLGENEEAFKLSFIENSLTSNTVLSKFSSKSQKDVYSFIELAQGALREDLNFEGSYSQEEINELVSVINKLLKVRDIVLKVNMEYIRSAAQANEYRNEPPFKLQGSYRNMNKIAERIVSVMDDSELDDLILRIYENDAQTLATGTEANMLKWKEIAGCLSEQENLRWQQIKEQFNKDKLAKADDKIGQAVLLMSEFNSSLNRMADIMTQLKDTQNLMVSKFAERFPQSTDTNNKN